jgi:hypothetical protein
VISGLRLYRGIGFQPVCIFDDVDKLEAYPTQIDATTTTPACGHCLFHRRWLRSISERLRPRRFTVLLAGEKIICKTGLALFIRLLAYATFDHQIIRF